MKATPIFFLVTNLKILHNKSDFYRCNGSSETIKKDMKMNTAVKNIFGVAAAIIALLGFSAITDKATTPPENSDATITAAADRPVATLMDFNNAIVDIAGKTNPAVVMITTEKTKEVQVSNPFSQFFGGPFGNQGNETKEYTQRGLGSGVIISEEGYILTNNHVIENTDKIKIKLFNNEEIDATLIGSDPQTDIAVLKIDVKDIPTVKMGDSENLKVGAFVLAIGSPLSENLAHTVSFGIVSAKGRSINILGDVGGYEDFIQTDAAINPGNSGGALIDMNGELVGINSAIASRSGGNDGIGFAIPINLAKRIMEDLIKDGKVSRGYLGLYFGGEVDRTMAKALGLGDARGIIVAKIEEDGPANIAGLEEQDVIVSIDGKQVKDWSSFRSMIATKRPNDKVKLGVIRNGEARNIVVTLGERDGDEIANAPSVKSKSLREKLGFDVADLNSNVKQQLKLDSATEGVVVSKIEESSSAYERGLRRGDVITSVKNRKVEDADAFYNELEKLSEKGDEVVLLSILRNDAKQFIAFEL